jgi:molybdopterin-guanine dinucleotide biosynthesis protein A
MPARHHATAAILIGGDSLRMGQDKASLPWHGQSLVERIHQRIAPLVQEVLIVVRPDRLEWARKLAPQGVRVVTDVVGARGPLAGIHAALIEANHDRVLVVACDMPHLNMSLLGALLADKNADVVVPRTAKGYEPLLAVYGKACLPVIERTLAAGPSRIPAIYPEVSVSLWDEPRMQKYDPELVSLVNVNRPEDIR